MGWGVGIVGMESGGIPLQPESESGALPLECVVSVRRRAGWRRGLPGRALSGWDDR
jgi:hypothetical protein